jgi:glucokinase
VSGKLAIAVDLGGTQLRVALVSRDGNVHQRSAEPSLSNAGPRVVVAQIVDLVARTCAGTERSEIIGAGVSSPGPLDSFQGMTLGIPTMLGFEAFPLREALSGALAMPVTLDNDGICAAVGEWRHGAGRGLANLVYVTVSTGIGGGVIAGGQVLRGRRGMAGHVGHMSIVADGEPCACGGRGCFEAYASGTAFTARARAMARQHPGEFPASADSQSIFAAAAAGSELARELVRQEARLLGQGFVNLLHLFSPEILVMGGGLSNQFGQLHPGIVEHLRATAMPAFRDVPVARATLGGDSGIIGAATLVFEEALRPAYTSAP